MIRGDVDQGRQVEEYPHPRASLHGNDVVAARPRTEDDPELGLLRTQPQERPDHVAIGLNVRRNVLPGEDHDDPFAPGFLVHLDAESHHSGLLDPPDRPDQPREVRVRWPSAASGPAVGESVHGLQRDGKQDVRPVARLEQLHQPDGRDGSHQGPDEAGPGQRHIGDRGPVGVLTLGAQADAAVGNTRDDAAEIEDAPGGGERALQLVAAHDLPHVDEDRGVGIAQLDDVEEHLLLPGIGHRRGVVEPVAVERHRSVARAAGEADRAHQDADPRGKGTDLDRERVRHRAATPSNPILATRSGPWTSVSPSGPAPGTAPSARRVCCADRKNLRTSLHDQASERTVPLIPLLGL